MAWEYPQSLRQCLFYLILLMFKEPQNKGIIAMTRQKLVTSLPLSFLDSTSATHLSKVQT